MFLCLCFYVFVFFVYLVYLHVLFDLFDFVFQVYFKCVLGFSSVLEFAIIMFSIMFPCFKHSIFLGA